MKNENVKINEEVKEEVNAVAQEVNEEVKEETVQLPIYVEKISKRSNGKVYNNYFVKSVMRGKDIQADFMAMDNGGYELLDMAFGDEGKKLLGIDRAVRTDAAGKLIRYNSYYVEGVDELGISFKVGIKPRDTSDKTYIEYIIAREQKLQEIKDNKD